MMLLRGCHFALALLFMCASAMEPDVPVEDDTVFDLFERSGITRRTPGVKLFRGGQSDSMAYRFIRFDLLPPVNPQALQQLLMQIQNNEGFILTATLRQDRTSRGTIMGLEGPAGRRQMEVVSDGRTNTLDLVYWWADGSRNVISFEDVDLSDSQWKNVTLSVHGETITLYVNCRMIESYILDEPFYEHLSASGGRMYVAKGSSREVHFRGLLQNVQFIFDTPLEDVLESRGCELANPENVNTVSESAEQLEVPSSIATNLIGQNPEPPATSSSELMCERSCDELASLFEELKGLRVVVSNLIDGLQKVTEENTAMREALNKLQDPVEQSMCWQDGRMFENKEDWIVDSCTKCTCQEGKVVCRQITCPPVACANPSFIDGECCPVCLRE